MRLGQGEVVHVGVEIDVAPGTTMLRVRDMHITGAFGDGVSKIMQCALDGAKPVCAATALRAGSALVIAAAPDFLGLGKVFNASDSFGRVGQVLSWFGHGDNLQNPLCFWNYRHSASGT